MIVILKNFKCFIYAKFNFEDNSNTLISGFSGCGKSTIFESIRFVLWGNKNSDIITFGEKTCSVTLIIKELTFKRSKNPNHFTINSSRFGVIDNPTDYVNIHFSKYYNDFLNLHSTNQIKILENLCFSDFDIEKLKENTRKYLEIINSNIRVLIKNNILIENTLKNIDCFDENVKKPVLTETFSYDYCRKTLKDLRNRYDDSNKKLIIFENECKNLRINESELNEILSTYDGTDLNDLESKVLENFKILQFYENTQKNIETIKKNCIKIDYVDEDKLTLEIKNYKEKIYENNYLKNEIIKLWRRCNSSSSSCIPHVDKIKDESTKICKKFESEGDGKKNSRNSYLCPVCNSKVTLDGEKLTAVVDNWIENVNDHYKILSLYSKINNYTEKELNALELKLKHIQDYNKKQEKIKNLVNSCENIDYEEIKKKYESYNNLLMKKKVYDFQIKKVSELSVPDKEEFADITEKIKFFEKTITEIENYYRDLKNYEQNEKLKHIYNDQKKEFDKNEKIIERSNILIEYFEKFKRYVDESEIESLSRVIYILEKNVNMFCTKFFNNRHIKVNIEKFKFIKSTKQYKHDLNISVDYNGNIVKLSTLSSGELARINLAFDLSLYNLSNSNAPLLLDEVTSNLDSEMSTTIYNEINKFYKQHKSVIIIAHQAIEGIFDNVITDTDILQSNNKK